MRYLNNLFFEAIKNAYAVEKDLNTLEHAKVTNIITFLQTWSSTALGFNRPFSGQAFTDAYTTVVECEDGKYYVFFDGSYAYSVDKPNKTFMDDLAKHEMKSVDGAEKHYGIEVGI